MSLIKQIALEHNDLDLFKFACELEKEGATNPMQMSIEKGLGQSNPTQALQYSRATAATAAAKADPSKLPLMRERLSALKRSGVTRIDDAAKVGMKAAMNVTAPAANVKPLVTGLAGKVKPILKTLAKVKG